MINHLIWFIGFMAFCGLMISASLTFAGAFKTIWGYFLYFWSCVGIMALTFGYLSHIGYLT